MSENGVYWILQEGVAPYLSENKPKVAGAAFWTEQEWDYRENRPITDPPTYIVRWSPHGRGWSHTETWKIISRHATLELAAAHVRDIAEDLRKTTPVFVAEAKA